MVSSSASGELLLYRREEAFLPIEHIIYQKESFM